MKEYLISAILLFATISYQSLAECSVVAITEKLSQTNLNASFVQEKKISALTNSLRSLGKIWISNDTELVWQVTKPIRSTMVIKDAEIIQFNRKDKRLNTQNTFAPAGIARLFYKIANGKLTDLKDQFIIDLSCRRESWRLELKPKDGQLSQLLDELSIEGSDLIKSFNYTETRGDITHVILTHLESSLESELSRYLN